MKHTIRRYGQLEQIDCELGSGYIDINGREIIEGDLVKNPNFDPNDPMDTPVFVVVYDNGESCFVLRDPVLEQNGCTPYPNDPLGLVGYELEIVGHMEDLK